LKKEKKMDVKGRVILITGASKGIGKAAAEAFNANGDTVIATSRNINKGSELTSEIRKGYFTKVCDVTDENNIKELIENIRSEFGRIDILINNAGIAVFHEIINTSMDEFKAQLNTNLLGTFLTSKYVIQLMMERKSGQIYNIISVSALKPFANNGAYAASKSGALMLTKVLREEVKKYNIKVCAVIPGATKTEIWSQRALEKYGDVMMNPEDIANTIVSLSKQSDRIVTEDIILRPMNGDL
jgi:3-oxoacyl-[acyl-carrier protein] reductase